MYLSFGHRSAYAADELDRASLLCGDVPEMHIECQHRFDSAAAGSMLPDDLGKHLIVHTGRINRGQMMGRFRLIRFVSVAFQIGGNVDTMHGTY